MSHQAIPLSAEHLNQTCQCRTVDSARLAANLEQGGVDLAETLASRPHLFSGTVTFVSEIARQRMLELIAAIERVVALPGYQEAVLAWAPDIARIPVANPGVFLGYDFHLEGDQPRLIEINTNAGGGLLNTRLLAAQKPCWPAGQAWLADAGEVEEGFVAMFRDEWRAVRGDQPLRTLAIVDETPNEQYLAPEFTLFRSLFAARGITPLVLGPEELAWDGQQLTARGLTIDLVYKRLTDFALEDAASQPLKAAYLAGAVVLTPHPRAHALYADKRNLCLLSDDAALIDLGVSPGDRAILLAGIPRTVPVTADQAEVFWQQRKQWFFKPAAGFGSRATYRGDKLTRRVFEEILQGGYIAQQIAPPSERRVAVGEGLQTLKLDLRNYVYGGQVQLAAVRLYQGQTTNFRTPGGGFSSVAFVPDHVLTRS